MVDNIGCMWYWYGGMGGLGQCITPWARSTPPCSSLAMGGPAVIIFIKRCHNLFLIIAPCYHTTLPAPPLFVLLVADVFDYCHDFILIMASYHHIKI